MGKRADLIADLKSIAPMLSAADAMHLRHHFLRDVLVAMAVKMLKCRPALARHLGNDLFADPVRDMLLDLYVADAHGQRVGVSSLSMASHVPATTALRWINTLEARGLLIRHPDETDGRRAFLAISDKARNGLDAYLSECVAAFG